MNEVTIRRILGAVAIGAAVTGIFAIAGAFAAADQIVEISDQTFPDETFRTFVSESFDEDKDGYLSDEEIGKVFEIAFMDKKAGSLKGIEYFTSLDRLYCDGNKLTELDLSKNPNVSFLDCSKNKIKSLDLSGLKDLDYLDCQNNKLTELDLTNNTKLSHVEANMNYITTLTMSNEYPKLTYFMAYGNDFKKLDISKCPLLLHAYTDGEKNIFGAVRDGKKQDFVNYCYEDQRLAADDYVEFIVDDPDKDAIFFDLDDASKNVELSIISGKTHKAKVTDENAENVKWESSDKKIANIDEDGQIRAVRAGLVTITATSGDKTASRQIRVLYKDLTDDTKFWFAPTYYLTDADVVKGYNGQTEFRGTNNCTRAQMVTFIWRLMGSPEPATKECKFSDVKESDYFYKACIWGNEKHIVEGYSNGTFRPKIVCARRHAVTFLWRLADKPEPKSDNNKFIDVEEKDYFYKATIWANEMKILEGYEDNTFRPDGDCLRRQMTTFLYKYDKYVNGKG